MPTWWSEAWTLFHTFAGPFAVILILLGIIIQFLLRPFASQISKGFHKVITRVDDLHRSKRHPSKKRDDGTPALFSTQELLDHIDPLLKTLDGVSLAVKIMTENQKAIVESLGTIEERACMEACPVFPRIITHMEKEERQEEEFLDKLLTLRKATLTAIDGMREDMSVLHKRLDDFLTNTYAAMEKKDELFAKLVTGIEKERSERANGGR
jgi:hypothetical protein